jgi:cell division protein FtsB
MIRLTDDNLQPGVQDSNAARAAVAANYMKQCSGLWIVAPITRAVDDKTAEKLLGDQFKRQLKYDGTYSSVTFICSKTDDISITEAADSLGLDDELADDWAAIDSITDTTKQLAGRIKDLKDQKAAFGEMLNQVEDEEDEWEDLERKLGDGRTVYAPTGDSGRKRKRQSKPSGSRKNRLSIDTDSESDDDDSVLSDSDSLSGSDKENGNPSRKDRVPLTEEEIDEKLTTLKAQKKSLRQNRKEVDAEIVALRQETKEIRAERERIEAEIKSMCIKGRNSYSRAAIKEDFASGIKEYVPSELYVAHAWKLLMTATTASTKRRPWSWTRPTSIRNRICATMTRWPSLFPSSA